VDPGAQEVAAVREAGLRRRDEIPETEKHPISRPERFSGPIGAANEGSIITDDPEDPEQPRQT
jgi:hypothetical protein